MHSRAGGRLLYEDDRPRQTPRQPVCTYPPESASAPVGTKKPSDHYFQGSKTWLNHYERKLTCPSGTETGRTSAPPLASAGFCSHNGADSTPARFQGRLTYTAACMRLQSSREGASAPQSSAPISPLRSRSPRLSFRSSRCTLLACLSGCAGRTGGSGRADACTCRLLPAP